MSLIHKHLTPQHLPSLCSLMLPVDLLHLYIQCHQLVLYLLLQLDP